MVISTFYISIVFNKKFENVFEFPIKPHHHSVDISRSKRMRGDTIPQMGMNGGRSVIGFSRTLTKQDMVILKWYMDPDAYDSSILSKLPFEVSFIAIPVYMIINRDTVFHIYRSNTTPILNALWKDSFWGDSQNYSKVSLNQLTMLFNKAGVSYKLSNLTPDVPDPCIGDIVWMDLPYDSPSDLNSELNPPGIGIIAKHTTGKNMVPTNPDSKPGFYRITDISNHETYFSISVKKVYQDIHYKLVSPKELIKVLKHNQIPYQCIKSIDSTEYKVVGTSVDNITILADVKILPDRSVITHMEFWYECDDGTMKYVTSECDIFKQLLPDTGYIQYIRSNLMKKNGGS